MAIPTANTMTSVDTLPGDEYEFTIGDPRWVMRSMADLYSNRETAVVREYSTNAYDEHVKFNVSRPIEVTLPSMLNPYFRVRDYAAGMSRDVLTEVYTSFGESTKRDSNDFNGMLGFGSKSAIAYTTSFKVTSIHNGIKTIALVHRKEDYSIVLKVVAEVKSDEPSGVEIEVPVHNHEEFAHKAMDFYKFWLPGRVLVDGSEPAHYVGEKITDGMYYSEESTSYVVMGNVPYRIINPEALFRDTDMRHVNFVAYVDNGDVEFTPSREDLKYTDRTKDALRKVITDFESKIKTAAQKDISDAVDHADAYSRWVKWTNRLGGAIFDSLVFGSDKLENTFNINAMRYGITNYRSRNNTYRVNTWQVGHMTNTIIITDMPSYEITSVHKRRGRDWCDFKGIDAPNYILFTTAAKVDSPWIDRARIISWNTIKKELPRGYGKTNLAGTPSRIPGSFDIITSSGRQAQKSIPNTGDVFYVSTYTARNHKYKVISALQHLKSDAVVIILPDNRRAKFERENPKVEEFFRWATTHVDTNAASHLTDEAKAAMDIGSETAKWVAKLNLDKVDDPDFAKAKSLLARKDALTKTYREVIELANALGVGYNVKMYSAKNDESLVSRYPLLSKIHYYYGSGVDADVYLYINAAYAARKDA